MKRQRDEGAQSGAPTDVGSSGSSPRVCSRRTVDGKQHGFPANATVVEEVEESTEHQTILLRFPCFDFFRDVHLCETVSSGNEAKASASLASLNAPSSTASPSSSAARMPAPMAPVRDSEYRFAPESLQFVQNTLDTDTPIAVLNGGTAGEMRFEGQWCEVSGDGTTVTNRAIVQLRSAATAAAPRAPQTDTTSFFAAAAAAAAQKASSPVASLLPHAVAGVTADEERRARREELHGWTYQRVDVPAAVLVMHRVR